MSAKLNSLTSAAPLADLYVSEAFGQWHIAVSPFAQCLWQLPTIIPMPNLDAAKLEALRFAEHIHAQFGADVFVGLCIDGSTICLWKSWPEGQVSSTELLAC